MRESDPCFNGVCVFECERKDRGVRETWAQDNAPEVFARLRHVGCVPRSIHGEENGDLLIVNEIFAILGQFCVDLRIVVCKWIVIACQEVESF